MKTRLFKPLVKQIGFTITEILVAMAIGLISTVVIFKALQSSNLVSANATGGSDSNQAGLIGLYLIERDIRAAGYGINTPEYLGCALTTYNAGFPTPITTRTLAPLVINGDGAPTLKSSTGAALPTPDKTTANTPDHLQVSYAGYRSVVPTQLLQPFSGDGTTIKVSNLYDFTQNAVILLGERRSSTSHASCTGVVATNGAPCPCSTYQLSGDAFGGSELPHDAGPMSKSGGLGKGYSGAGKAVNLGSIQDMSRTDNVPTMNEYWVDVPTQTLRVRNTFIEDPSTFKVVANNVINLYADYVYSDGRAPNSAAPAWDEWALISGVRLALLMRSPKPDYSRGNACQTDPTNGITTPDSPMLKTSFGHTFPIEGVNAHCYRYKIFETTVMMRNMLWR